MLTPLSRPPARSVMVLTALVVVLSQTALGQETTTEKAERLGTTSVAKTSSAVIDKAGLFSPDAVKKAIADLERVEQAGRFPTIVETVDSLRGAPIKDEAERKAGRSAANGIYILIEKQSHKLETIVAPRLRTAIAPKTVTDALLEPFKKREFDAGLAGAVATIEKAVDRVKLIPSVDSSTALVVRNQAKLTLAGARRIIEAAEAKAIAMGHKMNIAVVDEGGHLLSFARMDGARPASAYSAITKATSSATFRQETGPLPKGASAPDLHLSLSLQNAVSESGGKLTTLLGGIPVVLDGQVIGAVGVGGGTGEQDVEVAKAGVHSFLEAVIGPKTSARPVSDEHNLRLDR